MTRSTRSRDSSGSSRSSAGAVPPRHSPSTAASSAAALAAPGEASLAHRGVLLLDELAEFQRPALEALRQPLEDGFVLVSRAAGRVVFPARFQLVATMNLCACGGRGDPAAQCSCSAQRLARYRDKLSRALLDRFDLVLAMPRVRGEELSAEPGEGSAAVGRRVVAARDLLATRLPPRDTEADALLRRAAEQPHSPGAVTREWEGCEDDRGTRGVGLGPA